MHRQRQYWNSLLALLMSAGYTDNDDRLEGAVATLNDLTRVLGVLVDGWAEVTSTYVKQLFSGSDDAITQLGTYIKGGNWYSTEIETGLFSLQGIMENVLYGQLIPRAWGERAAVNPVVVFQSASNVENPLTTLLRESAVRTLSNEVRNPSFHNLANAQLTCCRTL